VETVCEQEIQLGIKKEFLKASGDLQGEETIDTRKETADFRGSANKHGKKSTEHQKVTLRGVRDDLRSCATGGGRM